MRPVFYFLIIAIFFSCSQSNTPVTALPGKANYIDKLGVSVYLPAEYVHIRSVDYFKMIENAFPDSVNKENLRKAINKFNSIPTVDMFYDTTFIANAVFVLRNEHLDFNKYDGALIAGIIEADFKRDDVDYFAENVERSIKSNTSLKYLKYKYIISRQQVRFTNTSYIVSSKKSTAIILWNNFKFEDSEPYIQRTKFYVTN